MPSAAETTRRPKLSSPSKRARKRQPTTWLSRRPGAPNATYSVGRVQHPDDQKDAAYVSCTWSEKNGTEAVSYEVVWILRQETSGWRIAGMATQLAEAEEPVFLNFEDLSQLALELENAERESAARESEVANRPQTTPPPQNPDNATLR